MSSNAFSEIDAPDEFFIGGKAPVPLFYDACGLIQFTVSDGGGNCLVLVASHRVPLPDKTSAGKFPDPMLDGRDNPFYEDVLGQFQKDIVKGQVGLAIGRQVILGRGWFSFRR